MTRIDKRYQKHMADLGLYQGNIDGLYGPMSKQSVIMFQRMSGLVTDGKVGSKTKAKFEESLRTSPDDNVHNPTIETKPYSVWPKERMSDLRSFYGRVGQNQTQIQMPYKLKLAWDTKVVLSKITCHEKVSKSLQGIFEQIASDYTPEERAEHGFDLFGGCLNVRKIRGGNRWSTHAWGIAIDMDPARNGLRTKWKDAHFSHPDCAKFVQAFRDEGWYSLGMERNYDPMHFQACYR